MYIEQELDQGSFRIRSNSYGGIDYLDRFGNPLGDIPVGLFESHCPLKSPIVVHLELTRRCALRCKHCYINAPTPRKGELSTEEWKGLLRQLRDLQTLSVYITGGDPRKHEGCTEIIQYASDIGLSCNLLINGIGLTKEFVRSIPSRVFVVVSYDGPIGCKSLRGISAEAVMEGVEILAGAGRHFALEGVLFHDNVNEMASIIRYCHDLGLDFQLIDILPIGRAKQYPELLLQESDLDAAIEAESEWRRFLTQREGVYPASKVANPDIYNGIAELVETTGRPEPGVFVAYISSDGYLYPDNYYAAEGWFRGPDLRSVDFAKAWQSSFARLRDLNIRDFRDCPGCPAKAGGQFCDLQSIALSSRLYGAERVCGAYPILRELKARRAALL